MGADNLANFHRWNEWQAIFELMPIAVEDRPEWRYRALASPAANRFSRFRVPESEAAILPNLSPPAWCYLSGPLSKLSSTALRAARLPSTGQ
jgi:nicotinate-nucleotide adenylyltransferase